MGLSERLSGNRVYFDANIFIYLIEPPAALRHRLSELLALITAGQILSVTSELSFCEVLTKPFRNDDKEAIRLCLSLLEGSGAFELLATSRSTYLMAASLRAGLGLKTPDAIHIATALEAKCSVFLSNDVRMRLPSGIKRVGLDSVS